MASKPQNFKADAGKPNPLLLETRCPRVLLAVIRVLDFGMLKSWQGVEVKRYNAVAPRHRLLPVKYN